MVTTRSVLLGLVWLGFVGYAFIFAPPNQPETFELIQKLSTGDWTDINPLIAALFNLMGILPVMYGALLFVDGRGQRLPAWFFSTGSFFLGAFALLPYLALRCKNEQFIGSKNWWIRWQDSRVLGAFTLVGMVVLLVYGLGQGDWGDYVARFWGDRFIHVMILDFCLLSLLFPTLLGDDLVRRGLGEKKWIFWAIACTPPLGMAVYLTLRPPTLEMDQLAETSPTESLLEV
ncbi:MAG: DUF2834 domain-containing protein [Limnothrix sp. RL_2_0]|nr:DUF2834 domain-containing protein [Limnothrix sp. RL_2_0]